MKKGSFYSPLREKLISGLLGVLIFFILFGLDSPDPLSFRLFSKGDPAQHYFGWRFFKDSPWLFPFGLMNNIAAPFKASVIFTDSIPLFAVIFKLFRFCIPENFNYFGIYTLLCFFLQGFSAYCLLSVLTGKEGEGNVSDELIRYMEVIFFILSPILIRRAFWHSALTSHYLILFSLCLLFRKRSEKEKAFKTYALWTLMGFLTASIHPYFLGIVGLTALSASVDLWLYSKEGIRSFLIPVLYLLSGLITLFLLGAFESGFASGAPGFGYYSFNLNGFFNGNLWSRFLNFDYCFPGQIEGFAYLGLGVIYIVVFALLFNICHKNGFPSAGTVLLFCLSVLIAASSDLTFNDKLLFSFDLKSSGPLSHIAEIFRSSGRFIWTAVYLLMAFGFNAVNGSLKGKSRSVKKYGAVLLFLALLVQIWDIYPGLYNRSRDVKDTRYPEEALLSEYWDTLFQDGDLKHLVIAGRDSLKDEVLYSLSLYALKYGLTINDFNFARALTYDPAMIAKDSALHPSSDTVYIFPVWDAALPSEYPELSFEIADGMLVGRYEH